MADGSVLLGPGGEPIRKAQDAWTDSSGGYNPPVFDIGTSYRDIGSLGLRQFGGWVREEFLPQLVGRQSARTYREMTDNSPTVGSLMFAIQQTMRKIEWRTQNRDDRPESAQGQDFAESLRVDMSSTWEDFVAEALSMLPYGFSVHEIVYKRRLGKDPPGNRGKADNDPTRLATSEYDDGLIGWRRLPIRGQDTILKWFFDENGTITGVTQQPWVGRIIDIPIEKMLLLRPSQHKGNPEGRSILRNCYRSWTFIRRLEEQEAILLERMSGLPVIYVPAELLEKANARVPDPVALAALNAYKMLVTNVHVDEQMGALLPSDVYEGPNGPSNVRKYELKFETPQMGTRGVQANVVIERHKLDILMTALADFIELGHGQRGTQSLAVSKVDMFFQAIEGWMNGVAAVLNRYALPRVWELNAMDPETMAQYVPDLVQRVDLDVLSNFFLRLAQAGMPLFPDTDLESYVRDAAGLPDISEDPSGFKTAKPLAQQVAGMDAGQIKKMLMASLARVVKAHRKTPSINSRRHGRRRSVVS